MQRRQFMKAALAAGATPMVPGGLVKALALPAADYAKAMKIAKGTAWVSPTYIKHALGLDDGGALRVVQRLQTEGLLGQVGKNGLFYSKTFFSEHARIVASTTRAVASSRAVAQNRFALDTVDDHLEKTADALERDEGVPSFEEGAQNGDAGSDVAPEGAGVTDAEELDEQRNSHPEALSSGSDGVHCVGCGQADCGCGEVADPELAAGEDQRA